MKDYSFFKEINKLKNCKCGNHMMHLKYIPFLVFSPNSYFLASSGNDKNQHIINIWET